MITKAPGWHLVGVETVLPNSKPNVLPIAPRVGGPTAALTKPYLPRSVLVVSSSK